MTVCKRCGTDTDPDEIRTRGRDGIDGCNDCVARCADCRKYRPRDGGGSTYHHRYGAEWYCEECSV